MSLLLTDFRTAHAELSPLLPALTRERERERDSAAAPMEMFPLYQPV